MKLNPAQNDAVHYVSGPCLVLAGAGSGKTRVIINKIAYLVEKCGYKARNIAAVTFTNKAAREMKERIAQSMGRKEARGLWISTFHTLGLEIIKREHKVLGLKPGFSLFDDQDTLALLKELTQDELDEDKDLLKSLASTISNWKGGLIIPEQARKIAQDEQQHLFAMLYQRYAQHMKAYNALDFDDLILLPTLLLRHNEEVRTRWQTKIQYLLVDEYQDTNTSQYEMVKLLVGERARFTVVGDDDQSIYSWRGAKPQNLVLLGTDFPKLKLIKLEQNYRSSQRILRAANILIANNPHVYDKALFSELAYGEPLRVLFAANEEQEAERVVAEIVRHKFVGRTQFGDYAILYRGNHQSRLLERALMTNRIPYKLSGGTSFFARAEIKDIMGYLKLVVNPDDDNAFLRIVNLPKRGIGPSTLERLGHFANEKHISMFAAIFEPELNHHLPPAAMSSLYQFGRFIVETGDQAQRGEPVEAVKQLIRKINYEDYLYETSTSAKAAEMRMKNISELYRWVTEMLAGDELDEPMTLPDVVNRLTLRDMMERNSEDEGGDQVQLMTLHASKGLEFPYVFMVGVEERILPHQTSIDEDNIDEERRLAYVGITRAQRELWFTLCRERRQFGETMRCEPSRFLLELPQDDLVWENRKPQQTEQERIHTGRSHIANLRDMFKK
ncbi:DNA helicase Rep [Shewanella putrefaciens]|uniref:ATP-dependent DNA helicase Rep n=1 Tax=Shewanella putrefaciens (strain CN-32 / ATCC BAA-453) TaxID=319224 RepID=A4YBH4_SHEPC|nr:DNA helicase Rep [Shewanella putrefaciens]MDR6965451.1 ATP-dependent DNA helicase Rep [Shewanella putrefaciens]QGS48344.1 DNA helicase Rep [Shewanella putrefaciens]UXK09044.1 DNA helicase Rep [Shewanella putrefaciens]CAD6364278.1 ATP-dependent DNA helicase Rep [Shewanella hafniensis]